MVVPADRPEPRPTGAQRPCTIGVTDVDLLRSDPFSFYAKRILRLSALDQVDADASAAWRGTSVHRELELWLDEDDCRPKALMPRIQAMLADPAVHPLVRSLWRPRIEAAARWVCDEVSADRAAGRVPLRAEASGRVTVAGVELHGKADRIDRLTSGGIALIDYKTGHAPDPKKAAAGYALQLGLLALIAAGGGFGDDLRSAQALEYWSLARDQKTRGWGYRGHGDGKLGVEAFVVLTDRLFRETAGDWLTGNREFKAKQVPEFALYGDYDQLMRLEEWHARL